MTTVIGRHFGCRLPSCTISRQFCSNQASKAGGGGGHLDRLLDKGAPKYLFVGGKGGVGKTTWAAALAVRFGRSGLRTLCVSTDPAHSLADALQVKLKGEPTMVEESLYGLEVDAKAAMREFAEAVSIDNVQKATGIDIRSLASKVGVDFTPIETQLGGMSEVSTAPPGMDELVAMARLMQLLHSSNYAEFDRIVIDTAPTGHTLRLLALPTFIHTALTTTMQIYDKVSTAVTAFTPLRTVYNTVLGKGAELAPEAIQERLKEARERVEKFQEGISNLNGVLQNSAESGFMVVSIPTQLAVDESLRLIEVSLDQYRGASSKLNELSKKGELQELSKEEIKLARDALDSQRTLVYESAKQAARLVEGLDEGVGVTRLPTIRHNVLGRSAVVNFSCDRS
ncbi:ATPase GET3, putative [Perkinsus marinus ATCC 50983]|uniref:ATPase GET3, putative n=1 Tax=Perkinsus marinus (strain ATCC 50983 / TXsc) TaxID=423536 RepID=C5LC96_PERM5|nr:ATPase GET3, putative [Perkinsus marinus ATCC 50983]EER05579.1 ATPase GET3, putative [Perkinsus marinus ATCC 50983]|eukprot:XP_002773763.1 ATPase GET3, putative [Perkinsus marinus ATCC 50983]